MVSPLALLHLSVTSPSTVLPTAAGLLIGLSHAFSRDGLAQTGLFGPREGVSIMNFASLGRLRCVCDAGKDLEGPAERRQFCRSCGRERIAQNAAALDRRLSQQEIKAMTQSLRRAAIRTSHLELPLSITSIEELQRYLRSPEPKTPRNAPMQPASVEHPQVY